MPETIVCNRLTVCDPSSRIIKLETQDEITAAGQDGNIAAWRVVFLQRYRFIECSDLLRQNPEVVSMHMDRMEETVMFSAVNQSQSICYRRHGIERWEISLLST